MLPCVYGSMNKTDKSNLMEILESSTESLHPLSVDVYVVDDIFFIRTQNDIPPTFGGLAKISLTLSLLFWSRIALIS